MKEYIKRNRIRFIIYFIISIVSVLYLLLINKYFNENSFKTKMIKLIDAFSIPGILFIMVGLLIILINYNSLSGVLYILKKVSRSLIPFTRKSEERYNEYLKNKKRINGSSVLITIGFIYIVLSIILIKKL